jgi:hypothetical protein
MEITSMFDITTARQIHYGQGQTTTVFQDRTDKALWYMVPVPRLRIQNGQPVFSLTEYKANAGKMSGTCTFATELYAPEDARRAAKEQIPGIRDWGEFTWVSGDAFFTYEFSGKSNVLVQTPSLFDTNVANFQVPLADPAELKAFVAAFSGQGALSPFKVRYEMGVLTQMLGAMAVVSYRATTAIEYERKMETRYDTWGNQSMVITEVRQMLQASGAGKVDVTPGVGCTPEVRQMVYDWATRTLETQVADAVASSRALAGSQNPVTATSDFTATYSEDAIVEWSTPVSSQLPRFDESTWKSVHSVVDNRELVVTFAIAGDTQDGEGKQLVEDVEVEVRYGPVAENKRFTLVPGGGRSSSVYKASGGGDFDPHYEYRFTVHYSGDVAPYPSKWIPETATQVELRPNLFGIRNVRFVGSNVPFGKEPEEVKAVFIDFFDNPPEGESSKLQTWEMTANGGAGVTFTTTYPNIITNTYDYRLRYLLNNDTVITIQPPQQFGSSNADLVQVLSPAGNVADLDLRAVVSESGGGFLEINANAVYADPQNPPVHPPLNHNWKRWSPDTRPGVYPSKTWTFDAQPDPNSAFFKLNGQILYGNGDVFQLTNFRLGYTAKPLMLRDTEEVYSVEVFPDQVAWKQVKMVTLNMFQVLNAAGNVVSEPVQAVIAATAPGRRPEPVLALGGGEGMKTRLISATVFPPATQAAALPVFFTVRRPRTAPNLVFFFNATYVMDDGSHRSMGETGITNELQIHLPALPAATPHVLTDAQLSALPALYSESRPSPVQRFAVALDSR